MKNLEEYTDPNDYDCEYVHGVMHGLALTF
jgi:hypothetical protein